MSLDDKMKKEVVKAFLENKRKREECKKKGHPGERVRGMSSWRGRVRADCYCRDCGSHYERGLNSKEWVEWDRRQNRTIRSIRY